MHLYVGMTAHDQARTIAVAHALCMPRGMGTAERQPLSNANTKPTLTLSLEELRDLTKLKHSRKIADWLALRGWVHEPPRKRGDVPVVDRTYYLARMSGAVDQERRTRPNFKRK